MYTISTEVIFRNIVSFIYTGRKTTQQGYQLFYPFNGTNLEIIKISLFYDVLV